MAAVLTVLAVVAVAGCGGGGSHGAGGGAGETTTLTVLSASSLTGTFSTLGRRFEAGHPGVKVRFAFDSSATLASQAAQGAPADVLATADQRTMGDASGVVASDPRVFAHNTITLALPSDNPAALRRFADLDKPGVSYVVCVPDAPCGDLAQKILATDHISAKPQSLEVDVKAVLAKVTEGEADAGIVYRTDAVAAGGRVTTLDIPRAGGVANTYPIAALHQSEHPRLARQWIDFVLSRQGQSVLRRAGFGAP